MANKPGKPGESEFNKLSKKLGGYVLGNDIIKYMLARPIPDNLAYQFKPSETGMQFGVYKSKRLVTRLHLYLYESVGYNGYMASQLMYVLFNYKVYIVRRKWLQYKTDTYLCFHIVLDEVI